MTDSQDSNKQYDSGSDDLASRDAQYTAGSYPDRYRFAKAWPETGCSARFKSVPEDFQVIESLPFTMSGEGEHIWLYVEKRNNNTDWVARELAKHADVLFKRVSYAGLKDRHAVTRQWFSVHLPGKREPDWDAFADEDIRILEVARHNRKLQRGALQQNRFIIRLRDIDGQHQDNLAVLEQRCQLLAEHGVPNYFGEQRFGRGMSNLGNAHQMFSRSRNIPRNKRSIYMSAARSWMFNQVLASRIQQDNWRSRMAGDVFMLEGSNACFPDDGSGDIQTRLQAAEIHPTAAMWGRGDSMAADELLELEQGIADQYPVLAKGLCDAGLKQQRRACRVMPADMSWRRVDGDLELDFALPAGSYATGVLAELCDLKMPESC